MPDIRQFSQVEHIRRCLFFDAGVVFHFFATPVLSALGGRHDKIDT